MEGNIQREDARSSPRVPIWKLLMLSSCGGAVNFGFTAEFTYATPLFSTLGFSPMLSSVAWFAGPIAGLTALPLASSLSDTCTSRFGKRRPYILLGLVLSLIGMMLLANPVGLSHLVGYTGQTNAFAIGLAVTAMWVMNMGLNVVYGPAWALVLDKTPSNQQHHSNAAITLLCSLASLIAQLVGFINFQSLIGISSASFLFYFGVCYVVIFSAPTIFFAKEIPLRKEVVQQQRRTNFLRHLWYGLKTMNLTTTMILVAGFFTFAAMAPYQIFFTDYIGKVVYHGNPSAPPNTVAYLNYQKGVRMGSLVGAISNCVSVIFAALTPFLMDRVGTKITYGLVTLSTVVSGLFPLFAATQSLPYMFVLGILQGPLNVAGSIITGALVARSVAREDMGIYVSLLNISQTLGQLVSQFVAGTVMTHVTLQWGMAVASGFGIIGVLLILIMRIPPPVEEEHVFQVESQVEKTNENSPLISPA